MTFGSQYINKRNVNMKKKLMLGDNMESLKKVPDNSIDSIVTDPPYGLKFMGKKWDYSVPSIEFWKEVYRVLKPGGHVLSFGGTRTYHRQVVNIEDAGFEIRDQIQWIYGSGFPKSLNIGKAVDKIQGNEREFIGKQTQLAIKNETMVGGRTDSGAGMYSGSVKEIDITKGTSPHEGWGTGLKPANEPICLARKPISENTIAENVLKWGTGGINIDGSRIESSEELGRNNKTNPYNNNVDNGGIWNRGSENVKPLNTVGFVSGRFPANIIFDEEAAELLDRQSGVSKSNTKYNVSNKGSIWNSGNEEESIRGHNDSGGASRFFYIAKVSKSERNMGLEIKSTHPTIKPINLMTYLIRLITPKGGIVLDPFMGSGSTGIAAQLEGFDFIGMEMEEEYFKIAEARINNFELYRKFIKVK